MRLKIRCDGESEKFYKFFWKLNNAVVACVAWQGIRETSQRDRSCAWCPPVVAALFKLVPPTGARGPASCANRKTKVRLLGTGEMDKGKGGRDGRKLSAALLCSVGRPRAHGCHLKMPSSAGAATGERYRGREGNRRNFRKRVERCGLDQKQHSSTKFVCQVSKILSPDPIFVGSATPT